MCRLCPALPEGGSWNKSEWTARAQATAKGVLWKDRVILKNVSGDFKNVLGDSQNLLDDFKFS